MRKILAAALVTLVCGAAPASRPAGAGECLELAGQWPWGPASSVALSGTRAYLGSGSALVVADIGSATGFEVESSMTMPGVIEAIEAMPSRRVLVAGSFGLRIVDFNDPEEPWIVGSLDTEQPVVDAVINGSFAYIVTDGRLLVVDVSYGLNLEVHDRSESISAVGVAAGGSLANPFVYVAAENNGLYVFDVSQSIGIFEAGHLSLPGVTAVAVEGSIVTVTSSAGHLRTVDVSQPDDPIEVGSLQLPDSTEDVTVTASRAYVANHTSGLRIVDLSDPANPIELGSLRTPAVSLRVVSDGSTALMADTTGFRRMAVDDPTDPVQTGFLESPGETTNVVSDGMRAFTTEGPNAVRIFNLEPDGSPDAVGLLSVSGANQMAPDGDLLYLMGSPSLRIIDVKQPEDPREIGLFEGVEALDGAIRGRLAVLASSRGLQVVDVENPAAPHLNGQLDGSARLVDLSGDFAYTVFSPEPRPSPRGTLHVVDLIYPANPVSVGQTGCDWIAGVAAAGDLVFAADLYQGLCVIDVSVPDQPVKIAEFPFEAIDVSVVGDRAYLVGKLPNTPQRMEVLAFDVSDPSAPRLIGRNSLPDSSILSPRISTGGGRVFVASGRGGLSIYSGCPNPVRTGSDRRFRPAARHVAYQTLPLESRETSALID